MLWCWRQEGGEVEPRDHCLKIRPDLMHLPTTNGDHSQGDGVVLAMDIGAKAIGLKHAGAPTGLVNPRPEQRQSFSAEALEERAT